jgi:hypothetical protein
VTHHRTVTVVHVLGEPQRVLLLRVLLFDLILESGEDHLNALLGVLMHLP